MDSPILGGGIILLVAVVLWLAYLAPSWASRYRFNATERNAVRLNQALRVLASTAETPGEVHLELDTRTAYEQQRMAKRVEAERSKLAKQTLAEEERRRVVAENERARLQRETDEQRASLARAQVRAQVERERAELEQRKAAMLAEQVASGKAQARARRRFRLTATLALLVGVVAIAVGSWMWIALANALVALAGVALVVASMATLHQLARVARRAQKRERVAVAQPEAQSPAPRPAVVMAELPVLPWTPRTLPKPMSSTAGSTAAAAQNSIDARTALRRAAIEEAARQRAAEAAPVRLPQAAAARTSSYATMGVVSDEEIEAHVRSLLARRTGS